MKTINKLLHEFGDSVTLMHEKINQACENLNKKKEELVLAQLKGWGIEINLDEERKRRFRRILIEQNNSTETWYFNDGSLEGMRIITFVQDNKSFNPTMLDEVHKFSLSLELSYY